MTPKIRDFWLFGVIILQNECGKNFFTDVVFFY